MKTEKTEFGGEKGQNWEKNKLYLQRPSIKLNMFWIKCRFKCV